MGKIMLLALLCASPGIVATPEELVRQLADNNFRAREQSERSLRALGPEALSAVKTGLRSADRETARRCESIVAGIREEMLRAAFIRIVGGDEQSLSLLKEILTAPRGAAAIAEALEEPTIAYSVYRTRTAELLRVGRGLPPVAANGMVEPPGFPRMHAPPPVPFADVAAWLLLGAVSPSPKEWTSSIGKEWRGETDGCWQFLPEEDHTAAQHMAKRFAAGGPILKLTAKWLENRRENDALRAGLTMALRYDIPEATGAARAILVKSKDAGIEPPIAAAALLILERFGTRNDRTLVASHLDDARKHAGILVELPKGITGREPFAISGLPGVKTADCQVRDLAAVVLLKLAGKDPVLHGFPALPESRHPSGSPKSLSAMAMVYFRTDADRKGAFDKQVEMLRELGRGGR